MKRFSIIVPIYNVEQYLPEMLESADRQFYRDFELVLVDDGSTDGCPALCDEYADTHSGTVVVHKPNGGLISARREGLKAASGEYIIFCDADDLLHDDTLESINTVIEDHGSDLVIYNADIFDGDTRQAFFEHELPEGPVACKSAIYDKLFLSHSLNSMCMKAMHRSIIDIDTDYSMFYSCTVAEDLLQSVPVVKNARSVYYLDKALYDYRISSGMTHKCNPDYYFSNLRINRHITDLLADEHIDDLEIKSALHLLIAAYAGTTQMKYADSFDPELLDRIRTDADFQRAWKMAWNSPYAAHLNKKQKLLLRLLYDRRYSLIRLLLAVKGGR